MSQFLEELLLDLHDLVQGLDHMYGYPDCASLVSNRTSDGLPDPPSGVGRELVSAPIFEFFHGFHQAHVAFLDKVEEGKAAVGDSDDTNFGDFIEDKGAENPYDMTAYSLLREKILDVLDSLTERERNVLSLRVGLKDGYSRTLEEVGKQFKVTRERIRQIEAKALRKMRHPTRIRQLHGFFEADQSSVNKPKPEALRQLGL